MSVNSFFGTDGFIWAYGIVENRDDPLFAGRCQVRWFGWHTEDKKELPTEDLPWATPVAPLDPGRNTAVGPKEGDWIFGFFRDGYKTQQPVMVGVMLGIPEKVADPKKGFNDPRPDSVLVGHKVPRDPDKITLYTDGTGGDIDEISPKSRYPDDRFLKESDLSRFERGPKDPDSKIDETIVKHKRDTIDKEVPTGGHPPGTGSDKPSPSTVWNEPETPYAAEYPYNHAYYSESGHLFERDDTPNVERIHQYHRSGTFSEIHPTGLRVDKVVDKDFHIVLESFFEHIEANSWETVDWGKKTFVNKDKKSDCNYDITVGANSNLNITTEKGELNLFINGDVNIGVNGNVNVTCTRNLNAQVGGNANITVGTESNPGNMVTEVFGDMKTHVHGNYDLWVGKEEIRRVVGSQTVEVAGSVTRNTTGNVTDYSLGSYTRTGILGVTDDSPISVTRTSPLIKDSSAHGEIQQYARYHRMISPDVYIEAQRCQRNCYTIKDAAASEYEVVSGDFLSLIGTNIQLVGENIKQIAGQEHITSAAGIYRTGDLIGDRAHYIGFDSMPVGGGAKPFWTYSPVAPTAFDGFITFTGRALTAFMTPGPYPETDTILMTTVTPKAIILNESPH